MSRPRIDNRTEAQLRQAARARLMLAAREVPDHLIQKVNVTVTVEFRGGQQQKLVEETWV